VQRQTSFPQLLWKARGEKRSNGSEESEGMGGVKFPPFKDTGVVKGGT